ncbi:autotransporter assembly complex protein TamA [Desulfosediminicola flagellatus]|uniref:autotransporter assembly complex protein TamA n=1 Tax=Desulfosediminicola flagellatus TaxID=2569541 RepID=UPI0010AD5A7B|nr:autotransporter assembly complex family protein [Desulfosediminicola flagellatus]
MACHCHSLVRRLILTISCILYCSTSVWANGEEKLTVEITGIHNSVLKNVEVFLSINNAANEQKTSLLESFRLGEKEPKPELSERTIKRLHSAAPEEIRQAMQPFGYYDPHIDAKLENVSGTWYASYEIDSGPATELDRIEIKVNGDGANEPSVNDALVTTELITGQKLDHRKYEETKSKLSDALYNAGFIDAKFTHSEIKVYPSKHKADITLIVDSGPRFTYGTITVEQDILHPEFVEKFANIKHGDNFEANKLIDFQLALMDSNYFSEVEIMADREKAVGTEIPVIVKTEPKEPRRYTFGLGYGTDTGPRVTTGAELRRINRSGHKMRFDLRASEIEQTVSSQYQIPIKKITTDSLAFTASASSEQEGDIDTDQFKLVTSINDDWYGFRRRLYLSLERENFDIGEGTQTSNLLTPGIQLSRKYFDDPLFPRKGYSATLDIHGGLESPMTETTFLHTSLNARAVMPLSAQSRLLVRGEYGVIQSSEFDNLPPSQRFFAGGDQSVRGYGYQDLSPKNSDGDVIGGQYLAVFSIEADYLFYKNFGMAAFFDAGNASEDFMPGLKTAAGLGLRYRSPVGMIRVDLATPLESSEDSYRLHISIGADL